MADDQEMANNLLNKLEALLEKQETFSSEIDKLRQEINKLKTSESTQSSDKEAQPEVNFVVEKEVTSAKDQLPIQQQVINKPPPNLAPKAKKPPRVNPNLEKFIGENLINKIGIVITVFGVAIGVKYSIEHQLISPLTRIILGYLGGLTLLGIGLKLKKNYLNYSAVLVSGAMVILYFITYTAYSFYDLLPQLVAFALMLIFTAFTVAAAINYNRQVIAHIGLVGAYAVPFLLSEGSGQVVILFSYVAIINIGILFIAFKKYWKPLYYSSFILTWLLYLTWYTSEYQAVDHFGLALTFLSIFFTTFYLTFLAYKLLQKEKFANEDIILLLANSFIFYGIGYSILSDHETGEKLLGLFTLANALIHFIFTTVIYRQKMADKNLLFLVSGLVLVFITIAIPVQLNGNWVTLLWVGEAALLFWIGRTKNAPIYEKISYILMLLAFISIVHDWGTVYNSYDPEYPETRITPLFNINFLSSLIFIAFFGFINRLNGQANNISSLNLRKGLAKVISIAIPTILLVTMYYSLRMEIANYWDQQFEDLSFATSKEGGYTNYYNSNFHYYKIISIINYSLLFLSALTYLNLKKLRLQSLALVNLGLSVLAIAVFLTQGLYVLSELREAYLADTSNGFFNIGIRYVSLAFLAGLLVLCYKNIRAELIKEDYKVAFDYLLYTSILWVASSELIHWLDMANSSQSYKLGLSILWGLYSLLLVVLGFWKRKKHLRFGAIALFGVTLLKLFFYDISHLDTIAKTIVLVSLGILLLIISFLYNKYNQRIANEK